MDFINSPEDYNIKHQYSNFIRILRFVALFVAVLLPGLYMAIVNFHQGWIPTELLFAIMASKNPYRFYYFWNLGNGVFFWAYSWKQGVKRVPNPIGPTLGIVGALVLGQAAVDISIVSPILIIIVSLTGICCPFRYFLGLSC